MMVFGRRFLLPLDSLPSGRTYALIPHQLQPPTSTRRQVAASLIYLGSDVTTPVSELNIAQVLVTEGEYTPHTASLVLVDGQTSVSLPSTATDWPSSTASSSGLGYSLPPHYNNSSVVSSPPASLGRAMSSHPPPHTHFSGFPTDTSIPLAYPPVTSFSPSLGMNFGAIQVPPLVSMPTSPDDAPSTASSYYNPPSVAISPSISVDDMPQPSMSVVAAPLNLPQPHWASLSTPVLMAVPPQASRSRRSSSRAPVLAVRPDGHSGPVPVRRHRARHPRRVPSAAASVPPSTTSPEPLFPDQQLSIAAPEVVLALGLHPSLPVGGPLVGASSPANPTPSSNSDGSR